MTDAYRAMLLLLLPLTACPRPADKETGDTADTADTGGPDTADPDTADTSDTDTAVPTSDQGWYTLSSSETECPDPSAVPLGEIMPATCGATVVSADGPGVLEECPMLGGFAPIECCRYPITIIPPEDECDYGRPLVIAGKARLAPLARGLGWAAPVAAAELCAEAVDTPPASDPADRAARWARIGLAEHASVASFSRFALELLAVGAPADLVDDAHAAARDEVRHAKLAFALAARGGLDVAPGPLPLGDLTVSSDLVAVAVATAREGCIAETLSALQMAEARDRATDPAERAALAVIARDEARHAALAWRTVRWAIDTGGERVREAVAAALAEPPPLPELSGGLLPLEVAREVVARGWREVIVPAAGAMVGDGADRMASP